MTDNKNIFEEIKEKYKLTQQEFLSFTTKLIDENKNNIGQKLTEHDDIVNLYFMKNHNGNSSFHKIEFDPVNKTLNGENAERIDSLYRDNEIKLIHSELRSNELIQDINDTVKELKQNQDITDVTKLFDELSTGMKERVETMISSINSNSYMSQESISTLFRDLERTQVSLEKIDHLLDKIEQFKQQYPKNEMLNDSIFNGMAQKYEKIDSLSEEWQNFKHLLEKQQNFQESILKIETESFLTDKAMAFKSFDFDMKNTSVSKYISTANIQDINSNKLIPLAIESNINNVIDRIENHVNVYKAIEYMNSSIKQLELYGGNIGYRDSPLNDYLEHNKQKEINQAISIAREQFKENYGQEFELFEKKDLSQGANSVIDKLQTIIDKKTFELHELANFNEPVTKKELEIRDFWENKNVQLIESYINKKENYFEAELKDLYLTNKDINFVVSKTPDLLADDNQFADKLINRFKETINDTELGLLQMKQEIIIEMKEISELNNSTSDFHRITHNQQNNNVNFIDTVQNRLEVLKEYINVVEKEINKEQSKETQNEKSKSFEMEIER